MPATFFMDAKGRKSFGCCRI